MGRELDELEPAAHATEAADETVLDVRSGAKALVAQGRSSLCIALLVVLASIGLVASVATQFPNVSVFDEPAHLDYVLRAESGEVPRMGDRLTDRAVVAIVCRGAARPEDCDADDRQPHRLGADGYQYEAQQPPVYYLVTGALRRVAALGPADGLLLTARLTGAVWLVAGLVALWLALARLRVRPLAAATILGVALASPAGLYQTATVNNDAAILLLGSLAIHFLLDAERPATAGRLLAWSGLAWLAIWTKPQILLAFVAMGVVSLLRRERSGWRAVRDDLWLVPVAVGGLAYLVWGALMDARAIIDPDVVLDALLGFKQTTQFPGQDAIGQLPGLVGAYVGPSTLSAKFVVGSGMLLLYVIVASDLRALLSGIRPSVTAAAGWVSLVMAVLAGPAFTVLFFTQWDVGEGPSPRYGLALLPGMLLGLVDVTRHRRALLVVQILLVGLATSLVVLIVNPSLRAH